MNAATQQQQEETPEPTEEAEAVVEETPTPELTPGPSVIDTSDSEQASAWGSMWDGKSKGKSGMIFYT